MDAHDLILRPVCARSVPKIGDECHAAGAVVFRGITTGPLHSAKAVTSTAPFLGESFSMRPYFWKGGGDFELTTRRHPGLE